MSGRCISIDNKTVEFICVPEICIYNNEDFKIYGTSVDTEGYPDIKLNKYGNCTILGNVHDLGIGIKYKVTAEEELSKRGYQYKIKNIKRERPKTIEQTRNFLLEILTENQAKTLLNVYPDIVDRVINNRLDDIDLNLTKGIKEYTFNVIKRKITENFGLAELVEYFNGKLSFAIIKKIHSQYPSIKKIKSELSKDPYNCLCKISGVGFKIADSLILNIKEEIGVDYDLKTSKQRMKSCVLYILKENENKGNTKMDIKKLLKECKKTTSECMGYFKDIILEDEELTMSENKKYISISSTYRTEKYIADSLISGIKDNKVWYVDLKKYSNINGIDLTEQQMSAIDNLCKYNVSVLNGYGGTGKTETTKAIVNMLEDNTKSFMLLAPTGRASKVLSQYTNKPASTIHRGLGYKPPNKWDYDENHKIWHDVVIVDECSMIDIFLMEKLLKAIDFNNTKLLMIGDSFQIPSVGAGNILHDIVNSKIIPVTTLTKVFRYGEGGLMTIATKTRYGEEFVNNKTNKAKIFGKDKSYLFVPIPQGKIVKNIERLYAKLLDNNQNPEDILILSAFNKGKYGTIEINKRIQRIANKNYGNKKKFKVGDTVYYEDDLVIQTINNYKSYIFKNDLLINKKYDFDFAETTFVSNGDIGKVELITDRYMIVKYDFGEIIYTKGDAIALKLAYSISTHKSQGGSCKNIIMITPKAHTYMLNANLIYVAQTRSKSKCYHFGSPITLNRALKKKANFNRHTHLKGLLKQ